MNRCSVGVNISELYRNQAREWIRAGEVARKKAIDAQSQAHYRVKDEHYCIGYIRGQAHKLETIEPFIKAGILRTDGKSKEECIAKMHLRLAQYYLHRKLCADWEACLDRAAEASIKVAEWVPR